MSERGRNFFHDQVSMKECAGNGDRTRGRLHAKRTRFHSSYRARLYILEIIFISLSDKQNSFCVFIYLYLSKDFNNGIHYCFLWMLFQAVLTRSFLVNNSTTGITSYEFQLLSKLIVDEQTRISHLEEDIRKTRQ